MRNFLLKPKSEKSHKEVLEEKNIIENLTEVSIDVNILLIRDHCRSKKLLNKESLSASTE